MNRRTVVTVIAVLVVLTMLSAMMVNISIGIAQEDGMMRLLKVHTPHPTKKPHPNATPTQEVVLPTVAPTSEPWPTVVPPTPIPPTVIPAGKYLVQLNEGVQEAVVRMYPRQTSEVIFTIHPGGQYFLKDVVGPWYLIVIPHDRTYGYVERSRTEVVKK